MLLREYGLRETRRSRLALALFARRVGETGVDLDFRLPSGLACTPPPRASQQQTAANASNQGSRSGTGPVGHLGPRRRTRLLYKARSSIIRNFDKSRARLDRRLRCGERNRGRCRSFGRGAWNVGGLRIHEGRGGGRRGVNSNRASTALLAPDGRRISFLLRQPQTQSGPDQRRSGESASIGHCRAVVQREQLRPACFVAEDVCGNTCQTVTRTRDIPPVSIRVRLQSQARLGNDQHPALIDLACVSEDAAVRLSPSDVGGVDAFVARPVPIKPLAKAAQR